MKIFREFLKYVSLSVAAMVCVSIYILADTWFISVAMGSYGLAALNISIAVFSIVHSFGLMISIGGATHYAIKKSKGENANAVFSHALLQGIFVSAIFVFVGIFFTSHVARLLGADGEILPMVIVYMRTILLFSPIFTANNIVIAFIRNDNNPKLAMIGMVTASMINIVFDYIFLFPLDMGMFGAALATGLAFSISLLIVSSHFWMKNGELKLLTRNFNLKINEFVKINALGSSALINELAFAVSLVVFNLVILGIEGNIGVAAFGVVANIAVIVLSIFTGVAQGIQPLISKGYGKGDKALVYKTLQYAIITVLLIASVVYAIIFFNATAIVSAFNRESDSVFYYLATSGLRIYFIGIFFAGINLIASAFFSAVDSAKKAVTISLLRSCIINIPMVITLGAIFNMNGVWSAFVANELVVVLVSLGFLWLLRLFLDKTH
ncbi:MAG: MATE family efflux transporter [Defluviitaleaceae bacterium]|nr:MATE family efflux transporter [Defluviitaleaceae bacterium]